MKMSDCSCISLPYPLIALLWGAVSVAMGQSDAPAKLGLLGRQVDSIQSAAVSIGGADSTDVHEITVSAITIWTDTGLDLRRGDRVVFKAAGKIELPLGQVAGSVRNAEHHCRDAVTRGITLKRRTSCSFGGADRRGRYRDTTAGGCTEADQRFEAAPPLSWGKRTRTGRSLWHLQSSIGD